VGSEPEKTTNHKRKDSRGPKSTMEKLTKLVSQAIKDQKWEGKYPFISCQSAEQCERNREDAPRDSEFESSPIRKDPGKRTLEGCQVYGTADRASQIEGKSIGSPEGGTIEAEESKGIPQEALADLVRVGGTGLRMGQKGKAGNNRTRKKKTEGKKMAIEKKGFTLQRRNRDQNLIERRISGGRSG